jgi:hypothetical protein
MVMGYPRLTQSLYFYRTRPNDLRFLFPTCSIWTS